LVETDEAYADMRNSEAIVEAYRANAAALNITLEELAPWQDAGSTDMANISHTLPAIHPTIQIADGVVWHTRDFAEAANTPRAYQAMLLAGKVLALTALDLLTDPELLRRAKGAARG
jgi:metal-dependent amidase/aminoacylase/carboxypeptidase family protein